MANATVARTAAPEAIVKAMNTLPRLAFVADVTPVKLTSNKGTEQFAIMVKTARGGVVVFANAEGGFTAYAAGNVENKFAGKTSGAAVSAAFRSIPTAPKETNAMTVKTAPKTVRKTAAPKVSEAPAKVPAKKVRTAPKTVAAKTATKTAPKTEAPATPKVRKPRAPKVAAPVITQPWTLETVLRVKTGKVYGTWLEGYATKTAALAAMHSYFVDMTDQFEDDSEWVAPADQRVTKRTSSLVINHWNNGRTITCTVMATPKA